MHAKSNIPTLKLTQIVLSGNEIVCEVLGGEIVEHMDICEALEDITVVGNKIYAKTKRKQ